VRRIDDQVPRQGLAGALQILDQGHLVAVSEEGCRPLAHLDGAGELDLKAPYRLAPPLASS
jgi:hypothetical protein